jgi:UDPglucose--hexose-1-phosphate uridylyltransferase
VAFVPVFARYPYEVWIATRAAIPSLTSLDSLDRQEFAAALQAVVRKYDALRGTPFPYVMVLHQAPTDGASHPEAHLHAEFYPPYRTPQRLKYLAGTEIGAGMFTNDAMPEAKAEELRRADVPANGAIR